MCYKGSATRSFTAIARRSLNTIGKEYIAGFFDGDGCIGIYRNKGCKDSTYKSGFRKPCWTRVVNLSNSYKPLLIDVQEIYGGRIRLVKKGLGQRYPGRKCKDVYEWTIGSKSDIIHFLEDISPFLREKKSQALIMLEECRNLMCIPM